MSDPVTAWLTAQRDVVERWLNAPSEDATRDHAQRFWDSIASTVSPEARELAQQLAQLGPVFLAGAGDALFEVFGAPIDPGKNNAFGRWLDLQPIGYFREHHAQTQELTRALQEYRRVTVEMTNALGKIHADALELLAKKAKELADAGTPITETRRLYDAWIECGERAFAKHASGDAFGRLQGELVNASTRLRIAQQTIAEYFLKSLDLPTRAELNSVHRRLKELRERVEELEGELAGRRSR